MKKVSCVVMDRDRENSLKKLREAGVLHLEKKTVTSDILSGLLGSKSRTQRAMGLLRRYINPKDVPAEKSQFLAEELVTKILGLGDEKKHLQDQLGFHARERRLIESWGDFDPYDLTNRLASHGIKLIPYELPQKIYQSIGDDIKVIVLSSDKRIVKVLALSEIPNALPLKMPQRPLHRINGRMDEIRRRMTGIENEFTVLSRHFSILEERMKELRIQLEFETAKTGMETLGDVPPEKTVSWISGFVPGDRRLGLLKRAAADNGWALVIDDPSPDDKPPTLVQNNAAVRIIHPLFSFLGTVPGYREYDISTSFLIFFCLFFSMIFGDAAYGLLLFIISCTAGIIFRNKKGGSFPVTSAEARTGRGSFPDAAKLFMLLSVCTVIWGTITGSWFAAPMEKLPRLLRSLIIPPFNNTGELAAFPPILRRIFNLPAEVPVDDLKTRWNIQFLCFTVGAAQLIWGRSKNIRRQFPSLTALAQAGWLLMMLGLYFLVLFMLLKVPLPPFAVYLIAGGLIMYFVFAEQNGGNFLKNIGRSFTNFLSVFLTAVGSFADIISYIRLFAVGLAGSIIAQSFNSMAIPDGGFGAVGFGFALRVFAAVLILIFGHALNIAMNGLSVIVHGVRLNLLEYAGNHLGMEWSGYAYKPFSVEKAENK